MKERISPAIRIWIATIVVIAGILVIAFNSYLIIVKNTADAFNRQQSFLVRESARGIEELVKNIETSLRTAADMLAYFPEEKVFEALFSNQQGLIQVLFLISSNGEIVSRYPNETSALSGEEFDLKNYLTGAGMGNGDVFITDVISFENGNKKDLSFVLGVPVDGTSQWICCIPNFSAVKKKFIYPIRSGKTGYAWMIDSRGVLLAHPNKKMEGKKAIDVLKELWPKYSAFNLEAIINKEMIRGKEGKGEYTGWHIGEEELTKKLIAYCPINFKGVLWSIGVSAPYREVIAPLMESIAGPVISLACFIVIIVAGACLLVMQERRKNLVNQELSWSREVFDGITDGISIIDRDYRVLTVNRAVCEWQGKPQHFFKGKPCYKVFQQQETLCAGCPAKETFETGKPAFRERVSITLGGRKYYFHFNTFPLKNKDGNTVRVAECVKDVTKEMALRSEIIQHERKSMIVKMSAQVAHEIRNPLGTLTLNVDLLEEEIMGYTGINTDESRNLISTLKSEMEGLHRVLQEYLECARFPKIKPEKQRVNTILEDLLGLLEEELRRKKIVFKTGFEYNLPMANVDQDQIRRAFLNIIRNAVEAIGDSGTIEVTTHCEDGWIEVVFADTGVGIPDDKIEKIFTPFFTTKSGGTGLGLSITQHIVAEHKGEIMCENRAGEGALFKIRIPGLEEKK